MQVGRRRGGGERLVGENIPYQMMRAMQQIGMGAQPPASHGIHVPPPSEEAINSLTVS